MKRQEKVKSDGARLPDGLWPVMLTPFCADGTIDWQGLDRLTDWYIDNGAAGLFAVCLSSEIYELDDTERIELAKRVVARAAGRVPVVASGSFGCNITEKAEFMARMADTGVSAVVLIVSLMAEQSESDDLWRSNVEHLLERVPDIPLGLYECPYPYHRLLTPDLLRWLVTLDRFLFLKDTTGDLAQIKAKLEAIEGSRLKLFNAHAQTVLPSLKAGAAGYSSCAGNLYPDLFAWLCGNHNTQPQAAEWAQSMITQMQDPAMTAYPSGAKAYLRDFEGIPITTVCRRKKRQVTPADRDVFAGIAATVRLCRSVLAQGKIPCVDDGTPFLNMWDVRTPDIAKPNAGFPILDAKHALVYEATRETGAYNHHPKMTSHEGMLHGMWSNHPHGEDGPGQRVLCSTSNNSETWTPWKELFPAPCAVKPSEDTGVVLTALQWLKHDSRLFAVCASNVNLGFTNTDHSLPPAPVRDKQHPVRARRGYSPLARELTDDGTLGPIFALWPDAAPDVKFQLTNGDPETVSALQAMLSTGVGLPAWDFEERFSIPLADDGHPLCEPTVYKIGDDHIMLLRDTRRSLRLYMSVSVDGGITWSLACATNIPDAPSLSTAISLPDGSVLLIGNQTQGGRRDPLTVSVSHDGRTFNSAFALRCGTQDWRVPQSEVKGRSGGGQYPSAVACNGMLHVLYAMGKEDIWASSVPLTAVTGRSLDKPGKREITHARTIPVRHTADVVVVGEVSPASRRHAL